MRKEKKPFRSLMILCWGVLITLSSLQAAPFDQFPGAIPLTYHKQAASDLLYQGELLLPDQARELYELGVVRDLSVLEPSEESILWKNKLSQKLSRPQLIETEGETLEVIELISRSETLIGQFALRALKILPSGEKKVFRVIFDPKGRNNLLRKALLEKIGYKVPGLHYVRTINLNFKGVFSKNEMLRELNRGTFLESERWLIGDPAQESSTIEVQDVMILEDAEDEFYNLALGVVPSSKIRGRRILNALLLPYNLVDVPESVNLMSWIPGRVFNKQLILDYEYGKEFNTAYEDARWITRRMLSLKSADWEEIVSSASYPKEVEILILNKILSRLEYLRTVFSFEGEFTAVAFDASPSYGARLKKGKLIGGVSWQGYATHFAGTDPDDPLSLTEMWSFLGSKILSNTISTLVTEFNKRFVPRTDLQFAVFDHQLDVATKQFVEFLKTGEISKIPFGFWHKKFFDMNIIANREVVAGNYMGSDNIVQLADTVGASFDLGLYLGTDGLPTGVSLEGNSKLSIYRTYTHLKPIKSIKSSLREPLRNMLVPLEKFLSAKPLDELSELIKVESDPEVLKKKAAELLKDFKDNIGIGESLIIQTGFGPDLSLMAGQSFGDYAKAYLLLQNKLTVISRLHIYRDAEDTFQVYNDPALINALDVSLKLKARVQILDLGAGWNRGVARTEYFNFNLALNSAKNDSTINPDFLDNVLSLKRILKWGKLDRARSMQKPWIIDHDFYERNYHFDFLWLKHQRGRQNDFMTVTHPNGQKKNFYRHTIGKRSGHDYQSFVLEVVDSLLDELAEFSEYVTVRSTNSGNPADTLKGKSKSRVVTVEGVEEDSSPSLEEIYLSVNYRYKGWSARPEKINSMLNVLNNKVGSEIFSPKSMIGSGHVRFYSVNMTIAFYEMAIKNFINMDRVKLRQVMTSFYKQHLRDDRTLESHFQRMWGKFTTVQKMYQNGKTSQFGKALANLTHDLEDNLEFAGLTILAGGIDNLYVSGHMSGFKSKLENGDRDIFSHSVGMIGSDSPQGPLRMIQAQSGVSEGELLLMWLMNRY